MDINAWPFLVSRNKSLGYRTIVAPDFMVDAKIAGLLANEAGGNLTDGPRYCELRKTKVGNVTLAYRVVRATDGDNVYRDEVGRPILWIEGLVLRGLRKNVEIREKDLQEAHRRVETVYREFWPQTGDMSVKPSRAFTISLDKDVAGAISIPEQTTSTWQLGMAILSVLLALSLIINVVQAGQIDDLEQTVEALQLAIEDSNVQSTPSPQP